MPDAAMTARIERVAREGGGTELRVAMAGRPVRRDGDVTWELALQGGADPVEEEPVQGDRFQCECGNAEEWWGVDRAGVDGPEGCECYEECTCGGTAAVTSVAVHGPCGCADAEDCTHGATVIERPGTRSRVQRTGCRCADGCECDREVTLTQRFSVTREDGEAVVSFDSHEGGCSGAEIGGYTDIWCVHCDRLLWASVFWWVGRITEERLAANNAPPRVVEGATDWERARLEAEDLMTEPPLGVRLPLEPESEPAQQRGMAAMAMAVRAADAALLRQDSEANARHAIVRPPGHPDDLCLRCGRPYAAHGRVSLACPVGGGRWMF